MARFFVVLCTVIVGLYILITGAKADVFITVDKSTQRVYVQTPTDSFEWKVSTGKSGHTTPSGSFKPYLMKPMHYSSKYNNAPMPNSIFFNKGIAFHATNAVDKLGTPASHGCVRLSPQNAKWLYRIVKEYGKENTYIKVIE